MEVTINLLAVLVAAVVGMMIGMAWYSPSLFGKPWMKMMGITAKDMDEAKKKGMGKSIAIAFLAQAVMAYVLAWNASALVIADAWMALNMAFWFWLGFVATVQLGSVLWEGRPWKLWVLNSAHWLVAMSAMSLVVALWK